MLHIKKSKKAKKERKHSHWQIMVYMVGNNHPHGGKSISALHRVTSHHTNLIVDYLSMTGCPQVFSSFLRTFISWSRCSHSSLAPNTKWRIPWLRCFISSIFLDPRPAWRALRRCSKKFWSEKLCVKIWLSEHSKALFNTREFCDDIDVEYVSFHIRSERRCHHVFQKLLC